MTKKLISQGAEAKIFLEKDKITKERIPKKYRTKEIDEKIRKQRTKHEAKILRTAKQAKINVPKILNLDKKLLPKEKYTLEIEYIKGDKLSDNLNNYPIKKQLEIMKKLGQQTKIMHENNIIHSDLTTSNTILKDNKVYIIDFGLSYFSSKIEDKAVDLHLIKQALNAKHYEIPEKLFASFLKGYKHKNNNSDKIIERLKIVEKRGRYKH